MFPFPGAKIHKSGSKLRCIEEGGVSYTLEDPPLDVPPGIAPCLEHAKQTLQKCRDVESAITNLEKQSSNESFFPVTIRRRPQKDMSDPVTPVSRVGANSPSTVSAVCQLSPSGVPLPSQVSQTSAVCNINSKILYR